jgi:putative transposase
MARIARAVVPGVPHHVTQRGNRRQDVFLRDGDEALYLDLMAEHCAKAGVEIWAYCLMSNHVQLIAVPEREDGLARAIGEAHRRYSRFVNAREGWTGYLFQGRFASCALDEVHLIAAARHVERAAAEAGIVRRARDYRWSSAKAHLKGADDALVRVAPMLERVPDWAALLRGNDDPELAETLERHGRTGRPLGDARFMDAAERALGRSLAPMKRGRKPGRPVTRPTKRGKAR